MPEIKELEEILEEARDQAMTPNYHEGGPKVLFLDEAETLITKAFKAGAASRDKEIEEMEDDGINRTQGRQ